MNLSDFQILIGTCMGAIAISSIIAISLNDLFYTKNVNKEERIDSKNLKMTFLGILMLGNIFLIMGKYETLANFFKNSF